jgi:hypothetical protein
MAAKKVFDYYDGLPSWAKGAVIVGVGLAAWTVYNRIYSSIKSGKTVRDSKQVVESAKNEIADLAKSGIYPSYSNAQYKIWADAAFACYSGWGTCSGDTIFVNMKNDADVLKLIEAFGIRTVPSGVLNPIPDFTGSLPAVMRDELRLGEIAEINKKLAQKGIKYQF